MGTENIFEFNASPKASLPELVLGRTEELKDYLSQFDGDLTFVPLISGELERKAAEALGVNFFGNSGELTQRFYDKSSFKEIATRLGVPVPEGERLDTQLPKNEIEKVIYKYLSKYGEAIIKKPTSAAGNFIYPVNHQSVDFIIESIKDQGEFLIEERPHKPITLKVK